LFSFGHGFVVASIAIILGLFMKDFKFPVYFDAFATWIAITSLVIIGTLNVINLLRSSAKHGEFKIKGIKGKFIPRVMKETTNPWVIILLGGLFALAADTVSQTAVWTFAAANSNGYLALVLGPVFMVGMMLTDTIDSLIAYRMLSQSSKIGQSASRMIGWLIVALAYSVAGYEAFTFFYPIIDLDFELVGIIFFLILLLSFGYVVFRGKSKAVAS
jgi:high-affinity nickel-transport protein